MKSIKSLKHLIITLFAAAVLSASCSGFLDIPPEKTNPFLSVESSSGAFAVHEGKTMILNIKLNKHPQNDVTIPVSLKDPDDSSTDEATTTTTSLTFTTQNWHQEQSVTIDGATDNITDGHQTIKLVYGPATSDDPEYSGYTRPADNITVIDVDTDSVVVSPTSGLTTTEGGGTAQFTVVLSSIPAANVQVPTIASSDTTEVNTIDKTSLTFTPSDWSTFQTVTITGEDDTVADGDKPLEITLSNSTSTDPDYNDLDVSNVSVTNTDNENASIVVTPTSISMAENDPRKTFTVQLTEDPDGTATISMTNPDSSRMKLEDNGGTEISQLTYTAKGTQTVYINAIDNANKEPNVNGTIGLTATNYRDLDPDDVSITITDDDTPALVLVDNMQTSLTEAGESESWFELKLNAQPDSDVTIQIVEDNGVNASCAEGKIIKVTNDSGGTITDYTATGCSTDASPTKQVVFTSANYNDVQRVYVKAIDDDVADGNTQYNITFKPTSSADSDYNGLTTDTNFGDYPVKVNVTNNDTAGFVIVANNKVDGTTSTVNTGTSAGYIRGFATDNSNILDNSTYSNWTMRLRSKPTANVDVQLTISDTNEADFSSNNSDTITLNFTTANWDTPQTVTLKGTNDDDDVNTTYNVTTSVTSTDTNYGNSSTVARPGFSIYSCDNDGSNVLAPCRRSGGFGTSEGGGAAILWFIAKSDPGATVSVPVCSNDQTEGIMTAGGGGTGTDTGSCTGNTTYDADITDGAGGNWKTMTSGGSNQVTVTGQQDTDIDGNVQYTLIILNATTGGATYTGFNIPDINIRNTDDEAVLQFANISKATTTEGVDTSVTFDVRIHPNISSLDQNITFTASCNSSDECTSVSPTDLVFTNANVNTYQTITINLKDDTKADGTKSVSVSFGDIANVDTSSDEGVLYGITPNSFSGISHQDNEKLVWVTAKTYNGNFSAASDMTQIDNSCASGALDGNAPTGSFAPTPGGSVTYKALIYHPDLRTTSTGWVLQANTGYVLKGQTTHLFTTDGSAVTSSFNYSIDAGEFWTGFSSNSFAAGSHCDKWDQNTAATYGSGSNLNAGTGSNCGTESRKIICVQQ